MGVTCFLRTLCFLLVIKLTFVESNGNMFTHVSLMDDKVCPANQMIFNMTSLSYFHCSILCKMSTKPCDGVGYKADTKRCYGCMNFNRITTCEPPLPYEAEPGTVTLMKPGHLVSGVVPIPSESLSASGSYPPADSFEPKYARLRPDMLNCGYFTSAWSAIANNLNQWIQARFEQTVMVTGISVWPAPYDSNYVQKYMLLTSNDCVDFTLYLDIETEQPTIFDGSIDHQTGKTVVLPRPISALCIRINPTLWSVHISLRFDVIGRYI